MESFYGVVNGKTAIIEMAACAGLPLVGDRLDPSLTTTYGVGELMLDAARRGAEHIIVALGGSATNDGGCGAAAACGIGFFDRTGTRFVPTGSTLKDVARIDLSSRSPELEGITITVMCDIDNPFWGPTGAAHIFGPQKGADREMVALLDEGMRSLAAVIERDTGVDVQAIAGSGAAGGMGGGMAAFFSGCLQMGIETVLDTVHFDSLLTDCDLVLTGEGEDRRAIASRQGGHRGCQAHPSLPRADDRHRGRHRRRHRRRLRDGGERHLLDQPPGHPLFRSEEAGIPRHGENRR